MNSSLRRYLTETFHYRMILAWTYFSFPYAKCKRFNYHEALIWDTPGRDSGNPRKILE